MTALGPFAVIALLKRLIPLRTVSLNICTSIPADGYCNGQRMFKYYPISPWTWWRFFHIEQQIISFALFFCVCTQSPFKFVFYLLLFKSMPLIVHFRHDSVVFLFDVFLLKHIWLENVMFRSHVCVYSANWIIVIE